MEKEKRHGRTLFVGVQGIHPWNGHGCFCGQVDIDGKFIQTKECMKKEERCGKKYSSSKY